MFDMMKKQWLFPILVFGALLWTSMQDPKIDDQKSQSILEAASGKISSYSTIKIDFSFTEAEPGQEGIARRGRVWMKGEMYHLRFAGQEIFSDGRTRWTYIRDAEEVHITSVSEHDDELANPVRLLNNYNDRFTTRWIREETHKGKRVNVVDLYPKKRRAYHRVRLLIDKSSHQIVSTSIFFTNNSSQQIDVNRFVTNEPIPDSHFVWSASRHPNVEIIDLR